MVGVPVNRRLACRYVDDAGAAVRGVYRGAEQDAGREARIAGDVSEKPGAVGEVPGGEGVMRKFIFRWQYGMFQTFAYLASHMDGQPDMQKHESAAGEAHRLWQRELIQ